MSLTLGRRSVLKGILGGTAAAVLWQIPAHAQTLPGGKYTPSGPVTVLDPSSTHGGARVRLDQGGSWTLLQGNLRPHTEYCIFFRVKATNLSFKLSGFKNPDILEYHNGTGDLSTWETAPNGRANLLNWLEHLAIGRDEWLEFRYDFTTGAHDPSLALAVFKAERGRAEIDGVGIMERASLDDAIPPLPPVTELSRGHQLILQQGFQFLSWIPTEEIVQKRAWMTQPPVELVHEMGLTGVQFNDPPCYSPEYMKEARSLNLPLTWAGAWGPFGKHLSGMYQDLEHVTTRPETGSPTQAMVDGGFLTPETGADDLERFVAMCVGDEENWSDTLVQNLKAWFEVIRKHYPNALAYHNEVGTAPRPGIAPISTFSRDQLAKYMSVARPDLISFDLYYFRERRVEQTIGGTVMEFVGDLNRYRLAAAAGHDGTGRQPIPWGHYHYSWRTGPGAATELRRGDGWYELTESQVHLYSMMALTFGAQWMSNFRWIHNAVAYLFTDYRQTPEGGFMRYKHFEWFQENIRQCRNVASHLIRLHNKEVAVLLGQHRTADGGVERNERPADNPELHSILDGEQARRVFLTDAQASNLGIANQQLPGDVFIGFFDPLGPLTDEHRKLFTSTDPRYFMVLNGMTAGDGLPAEMQQGSSYETRQEVRLRFTLPDATTAGKLRRVSRFDGGIAEVPLRHVGGNVYELATVIGGGLADLYFWELGDKKPTTAVPTAETPESLPEGGDPARATHIPTRDLKGRTIKVGVVPGATSITPVPQLGRNTNPPAGEVFDGREVALRLGGDIAAIGERYYTQDIWEFRVDRIQRDNNCTVEFMDLDLDQSALSRAISAGSLAADVVVVPDSWLWHHEGNLVDDGALMAWNDVDAVDVSDDKWKRPALDLATVDGGTWGLWQDHTTNFLALFANRAMLRQVGVTRDFRPVQRNQGLRLSLLRQAISNVPDGTALFADSDDFLRQLLIACGVETRWEDLAGDELAEAMAFYDELRDRRLLVRIEDEAEIERMFGAGELGFMVRPYTSINQYRRPYFVWHDNTARVTRPLRSWGVQTMTWPEDGTWKITAERRAGQYPMAPDDVAVLLFPTPEGVAPRQAIVGQSLVVLPGSTQGRDDVAFVVNELMQEYQGVWNLEFTRRQPWLERMNAARDLDTVRKVGLRDAYGDALAAAGDWEAAALGDLIRLYHGTSQLDRFLRNPALARATAGVTRALYGLWQVESAGGILPDPAKQVRKALEKAYDFAEKWLGGHAQSKKQVAKFIEKAEQVLTRHGAGKVGMSAEDHARLVALIREAAKTW